MENRNESVIGKIVAFVVTTRENWPENGKEFNSPKAALEFGRGWYFVKLALPSGKFDYEPGLHNDCCLGHELYARPCTECKRRTWVRRYQLKTDKIYCLDCQELALEPCNDPNYDWWEEHRQKCDGNCPICDPRAYPDED